MSEKTDQNHDAEMAADQIDFEYLLDIDEATQEVLKRVTRIETRLCTLMEHLGMKPVNVGLLNPNPFAPEEEQFK